MKSLLVILLNVSVVLSQESLLQQFDDELSLLRQHGISQSTIDQYNIFLRHGNGPAIIKNLQQPTISIGDTGDLILTLADLDTMAYYNKYRFMAELPLGDFSVSNKYVILDANNNGINEFYGNKMRNTVGDAWSHEGVIGFEVGSDTLFKQVFFLPDSFVLGHAAGNVDGDALVDFVIQKGAYPDIRNFLYSQSSPNSFPYTVQSEFDTLARLDAQLRSFVDLDDDGRDEMIYKVVGSSYEEFSGIPTVVARYDTIMKEFKTILNYKIKDPGESLTYTHGLSFGDFDGDGKLNVGTGSQNGYAYTHEYQGNNVFTTTLIAQVPTKNLYLTCVTNDFNKNGKPEVWFGGDTFFNGTAITRLFAFEATGDDQYQKVYQIDIVGLFSFIGFGMHSRDMDNDGKDELFVHLAQRILIFKSNDQGKFELWFIKINELAAAGLGSVIYSSDAEDLTGDGNMEIILETDLDPEGFGIKKFTTVFKRSLSTSVHHTQSKIPSDFHLYQNYPNPFNNQTNIRFSIPQNQNITIKIYNSLGKEIVELINDYLPAGTHTIPWKGTTIQGESVNSGVYFISVEMKGVKKTIKAILIK
ncbi:MAG: T9SS type A sorting domain-containing protein [Bacteroidota bacterium]